MDLVSEGQEREALVSGNCGAPHLRSKAVARQTIKGCSQAGHVSIGVFMMLL